MPLRSYKATSPGRRWMTRSTFEEITTDEPHKPLLEPMKRGSGRNNQGRLTVRHRGGGEKTHYRIIDFKRDKPGVPARLATIEYDPNRSARIGLLHYRDGEKRYMLLPNGLKVGDVVVSGPDAEARVGNALPIAKIPLGTTIHNIELIPGKGGQIVRSAGHVGPAAREGGRLRPGAPALGRGAPRAASSCMATIGQVSNVDHENQSLGKAGRARHMGQRPEVRGVAMTPRDHPHGGGEGKRPRACPPRRRGASPPWATGRGEARRRADSSSAAGIASRKRGARACRDRSRRDRSSSPGFSAGSQDMNKRNERKVAQDLVARVRHLPRFHRAHDRRLQRPQARAGVRHREHGRPSTRRVRAHPHVSRARPEHADRSDGLR